MVPAKKPPSLLVEGLLSTGPTPSSFHHLVEMGLPLHLYPALEDTARYAGQGFFCTLEEKNPYYAILAHFWPFLVSSSNLGNFFVVTLVVK